MFDNDDKKFTLYFARLITFELRKIVAVLTNHDTKLIKRKHTNVNPNRASVKIVLNSPRDGQINHNQIRLMLKVKTTNRNFKTNAKTKFNMN